MDFKRPFSESDWLATPEPVRKYVEALEQAIVDLLAKAQQHEKRIAELERRLNLDSQNSSKPPSSDSPYRKPRPKTKKKKKSRKRGGQKGHKGHRQQLLEPTEVIHIKPERCGCGQRCSQPQRLKAYYTHQYIELPKIRVDVTHLVLHKSKCTRCGKTVKARLPREYRSGYGPRFSAMIAELSGNHGASRQAVQSFCHSVFDLPISTGAIQKVIDRASQAIAPLYEKIGACARRQAVNGIDETSWRQGAQLKWLWTMASEKVCFFKVHNNRSKEAFEEVIGRWRGILISDDYHLYTQWVRRQSCLAHLIRKARALSQHQKESLRRFGKNLLKELQLLCHWAKAPPDENQWTDFYSRLLLLLMLYEGADDEAGRLARRVAGELDSLWLFLEENAVEPTNNRAERALRFGVLWRKRSNGTQSEKGNRWVERILSLRQTCRQRALATYPILVNAISCSFKERRPDLSWI
jgi:transposase